jgi:hypothetical protein
LSLHRSDADEGYVSGNVEWLCDGCNREEKHLTPRIALHVTLGYILNKKFNKHQLATLRTAVRM